MKYYVELLNNTVSLNYMNLNICKWKTRRNAL